jgi:hypothetical protein
VVQLDGNTVVSTHGGAYVSFSPDGSRLVYTSDGLHILDLTTGADRVVSEAIREFPKWSCDGQTIAGTGFKGRLVLLRPDGRLVAIIKNAQTLNDAASWGGADLRVAFVHTGWCGIDIAHADEHPHPPAHQRLLAADYRASLPRLGHPLQGVNRWNPRGTSPLCFEQSSLSPDGTLTG